MALSKRPSRKTKMSDKQAEKFIMAASARDTENEERFIQTPVRFPPALLARIDRAAKRRGLNRSSWLRYAATKELDLEELSDRTDAKSRSNHRESTDNITIPVWLHATESFYKKLNRIAKECGLPRYEALSRGLDALLRETEIRNSALNRNIRSTSQSEVFRRTMGQVSRNYWATVSPEEKRRRAQNSARARWGRLADSQS